MEPSLSISIFLLIVVWRVNPCYICLETGPMALLPHSSQDSMARAIRASLPVAAVTLLGSDDWTGGALIVLSSEVTRPTSSDVALNAPWVEPVVHKFPDKAQGRKKHK